MNGLSKILQDTLGIAPENQTKLFYSVLILVAFGLIRFAMLKIVWRLTEDPKTRYTWKRTASFTLGTLTLIMIGSVWIRAMSQFGAFLGLLTAGLAIALKDLLTNIAGWIFILTRKPFGLGDRVQIGDLAGDVIDIRIFQFTILEIRNWVKANQSTGRIIHVPNGTIFTKAQANYTSGFKFIWNEIAVLLTMRFICDPRKRRASEHEVWEEVLKEFARHREIEFAYPTQRFFTRPAEKDDSPL